MNEWMIKVTEEKKKYVRNSNEMYVALSLYMNSARYHNGSNRCEYEFKTGNNNKICNKLFHWKVVYVCVCVYVQNVRKQKNK